MYRLSSFFIFYLTVIAVLYLLQYNCNNYVFNSKHEFKVTTHIKFEHDIIWLKACVKCCFTKSRVYVWLCNNLFLYIKSNLYHVVFFNVSLVLFNMVHIYFLCKLLEMFFPIIAFLYNNKDIIFEEILMELLCSIYLIIVYLSLLDVSQFYEQTT